MSTYLPLDFSAKYRRAVIDMGVDSVLKEVFLDIEKQYLKCLEIGVDQGCVHF